MVGPGLAIDGVTLNVAKIVGASIKFQPGKKDSRLLHAATTSYERMIRIARNMDVIFYDVTTRRSWLVGGDDALLYLSRAAISHPEGERVYRDSQGQYPKDRFKHVETSILRLGTSEDVLVHQGNRDLVIYDEKPSPWRFENLVRAHFDLLQEIKSWRDKLVACEKPQWEIRKPGVRKDFIGFGCLDIISGHTSLRPRLRELKESATHWLKLADAIDSVNIIGAGIDDLIVPSPRNSVKSIDLPSDFDVLGAPLYRLQRIAQIYGRIYPDCVQLAHEVFWKSPEDAFHSDPCLCNERNLESHCGNSIIELRDRRQTLFKRAHSSSTPCDLISVRHPAAAVCFGSLRPSLRARPSEKARTPTSLSRFLHFRSRQPTTIATRVRLPASSASGTSNTTQHHRASKSTSPETAKDDTLSSRSPRRIDHIWTALLNRNSIDAQLEIDSLMSSANRLSASSIDQLCKDSKGFQESFLSFAARTGDFQFAEFLLRRGFPANEVNGSGKTPLEEAASSNHVNIMQLLLTGRTTSQLVHLRVREALTRAIQIGHNDAVNLLLASSGADLNLNDALQTACESTRLELVHFLIKRGADPNFDESKLFRDAVAFGPVDLVEALLLHDIDSSLVLALTSELENLTVNPDRLPKTFQAKLALLRDKRARIQALHLPWLNDIPNDDNGDVMMLDD